LSLLPLLDGNFGPERQYAFYRERYFRLKDVAQLMFYGLAKDIITMQKNKQTIMNSDGSIKSR
jgi:hypothetical protein